MRVIKYCPNLLVLLYSISLTACYTVLDSPLSENNQENEENGNLVVEEPSDTVYVKGDYTIINNYTCSNESTCCNHDYCHTSSHSYGYHSCGGHCYLSFDWWAGTWVSYSCNYCHHHSCSGYHYGHYHGHAYYHHGYNDGYHDGYWWGYNDGYYDGYWWGSNDGWNDDSNNSDDYSDNDGRKERRENSFDRTSTNEEGNPEEDNLLGITIPSLTNIKNNGSDSDSV